LSLAIFTAALKHEQDLVAVRRRAWDVAELLGFDAQDQTRIATAVSEIGRNAYLYAGNGKVEFQVEGSSEPQVLLIRISDEGPGIADLKKVLSGRYRSATGMGLGIAGARRLMDQFDIQTHPGKGTAVTLKMFLPRKKGLLTVQSIAKLTEELVRRQPAKGPYEELQQQNRELLRTLDELRKRQDELSALNRELEDTNRGVVALYAELDEKAEHLRRADRLKTQFLSNMSHEFRTPVNSIIALANLLLSREDSGMDENERQQVAYIKRSGDGLLDLVNDLLDLAKVEAGKVEVRPVEFEVSNLFSALRGMLRPLLVNPGLNLVFDDASGLPPLLTDESKVSQILRNFISNALKFTERGEVRVSVKLEFDSAVFSVRDTGIGIAPEDQERIFEEFTQVDSAPQRKVKGTGLGLPLSKKLAELLGGRVWVVSVPEQGSTFFASIPLAYRKAAASQTTRFQLDPRLTPVLLVEDSMEITMLYTQYLKNSVYQLVPAASLREARQALQHFRPAAFILDIMLQGEDTWSFLAELKAQESTREIPVLVETIVDDEQKALALGADAFLAKPVDRAVLLREISRLIKANDCVLVVDDDEVSRYLVRQALVNVPCAIVEAADGEEALRLSRRQKPALITLDLNMPGLTGFEVLDELKTNPATSAVPVAVITSQLLTDVERAELSARADAVITKSELGDVAAKAKLADLLNSSPASGR
jgi:signal transduction histidine kinase/DNA-binding response OmpR family regulator